MFAAHIVVCWKRDRAQYNEEGQVMLEEHHRREHFREIKSEGCIPCHNCILGRNYLMQF